ncbi:MAG: hypothetical protein OXG78_07120 [Chloroflexi bacterium]|nr:hypothetical protein [Chloroflexota bacterium]
MLTKVLNWLLPQWARNPLLEYEWFHPRLHDSRRGFIMQLSALALLLGSAALIYAAVTGVAEGGQGFTRQIWQSLYFPTLVLQSLASIAALLTGAAAFDVERRGTTWDNLRITEIGAGLALRARWMGILYRLRAPIAALLLVRLIFALGMLVDLTAFGGNYVKMLSADAATARVDWQISIVLIALSAIAGALLPLPMIASFAALGILLGLTIKEGLFAAIIQILVTALVVAFICAGSYALSQVLSEDLKLPDLAESLLLIGYSAYGDWGLLLMQLGSLGALWHSVSFGAFTGVGLAGLLLAQGTLADGMISLAERIPERRG